MPKNTLTASAKSGGLLDHMSCSRSEKIKTLHGQKPRPTLSTNAKKVIRQGWPTLRRWILQLLLKTVLWCGLLAVLVGSGYLYYLGRGISETFEGRRWSVPAQIYAQPVELWPANASPMRSSG